MNRFLLDTHVLLWALFEPSKLSDGARKLLENPATVRFVSAASAWEISTKFRLGKLDMAKPLLDDYQGNIQLLRGQELQISTSHSLTAGGFQQAHRDPFDRILAAQSQIEELPLLTIDPAFSEFPIQTVW